MYLTLPAVIAFFAAGVVRVVLALLLAGLLCVAFLSLVAVLLIVLAGLLLAFLGLLLHLGLPFLDAFLPLLAFQLQAFGLLGIAQAFILSILIFLQFVFQRLAALLLLLLNKILYASLQ
ncbi:MAG: hypothetical protein ACK5T0_04840 [Vampirovibrionales bacterium]